VSIGNSLVYFIEFLLLTEFDEDIFVIISLSFSS